VGDGEVAGDALTDPEGDPDGDPDGAADDVAGAGDEVGGAEDGTAAGPANATVPASDVTDTSRTVFWCWLMIRTCTGADAPRA
jgi:hypothetical protein